MTSRNQVTVQRLIPAPASAIFDLLADPSRHPEFDGSGHVVKPTSEGARRLKQGDRFGMEMKRGAAYKMLNVVYKFDENRQISWQTIAPGIAGKFVGGRRWSYHLEPAEGGTLVSETWDISDESVFTRAAVRRTLTEQTRTNMARSLERIEEIVSA